MSVDGIDYGEAHVHGGGDGIPTEDATNDRENYSRGAEEKPSDQQRAAVSDPAKDDLSPPGRTSLAELGINRNNLKKLVLKIFYLRGCETAKELSDIARIHIGAAKELLEESKRQGLVEILGSMDQEDYQDFRYALTGKGREWAADALNQNQYVFSLPGQGSASSKAFVSKLVQAMGNYWCNCGIAVFSKDGTSAQALYDQARQFCHDSGRGASSGADHRRAA